MVEELFSILQPLSFRCNVTYLSLLCHYFHDKCSDELFFFWGFIPRTCFATSTELTHPCFPRVPNLRRKFHSDSFFPMTATLLARFPCVCFPKHFNIDLFKSRFSYHHFISLSYWCCTFSIIILTVNLYLKWLSSLKKSPNYNRFCFLSLIKNIHFLNSMKHFTFFLLPNQIVKM